MTLATHAKSITTTIHHNYSSIVADFDSSKEDQVRLALPAASAASLHANSYTYVNTDNIIG
jgi:hypothetical protein